VLKTDKKPYLVFTVFYNKSKQNPIQKPHTARVHNFFHGTIKCSETENIYHKILADHNKNIAVNGGHENALKILHNLPDLKDYADTRDIPWLDTSHLSAHLKFGTISVREVYYAIVEKLGAQHPLLRQLYWRDFFTHIAFHFPTVFGHAFNKKYDSLQWNYNTKFFNAWCNGTTGFPIVDAGMRQLNTTGFMHNRVRMIVASFLTKDLHISWLKGEKYFAQNLVDYDPAVNNGNWQWCASTGCDAQPYFRIFNPWLQQKKFDPDCMYIKKWVPELKNEKPSVIHSWFKDKSPIIRDYPRPIVDHGKESKHGKMMYKKAK
jgi:deoxyribodipyrimidine photo-lyase